MVSWDDVFMADLPANASGRNSTGFIESSGGRQARRQAQGAPKRSGIFGSCSIYKSACLCRETWSSRLYCIVGSTGIDLVG